MFIIAELHANCYEKMLRSDNNYQIIVITYFIISDLHANSVGWDSFEILLQLQTNNESLFYNFRSPCTQ